MKDLFESIRQKDIPSLTQMIREHPEYLGTTNPDGITPLLFSAYLGDSEITKTIYSTPFAFTVHERTVMDDVEGVRGMLGADMGLLNSFSQDGWTALHLSAFFGYAAMVKILLDKGAFVDIPSRSKASYGNSPMQAAIAMGRLEVVNLLLDRGANVNFVQEPGLLTPLHIAASRPNIAIVRVLVERGADRDALSADGKKPVDIADERQNLEIAQFLRA